jgi:hypothetical protein
VCAKKSGKALEIEKFHSTQKAIFYIFRARTQKSALFAPFFGRPTPISLTTHGCHLLFLAPCVDVTLSDHLQQQYLGSELMSNFYPTKRHEK